MERGLLGASLGGQGSVALSVARACGPFPSTAGEEVVVKVVPVE